MIKLSLMIPVTAMLALSACGGEDRDAERARLAAEAQNRVPSAPALAAIYERSCVACHVSVDSDAPIQGDTKDWRERFAKGDAQVLTNAMTGIRGMPPRGSCFDCSTEDIAALTEFLSGHTFKAETVAAVAAQEGEKTP